MNCEKVTILSLTLISILISSIIPKGNLTPEIIATIKGVSDPQISADSKKVAFVVTEIDTNNTNSFRNSDIWIVPLDRNEKPRRYAFSKYDEKMPRWSPDGKYLAFLSNRENEERNQIYIMRTDGGEAYRLTNLSGGVVTYKWSKNSNTIFFIAVDSLTKYEKERKDKKDDEIILDYNYKYNRLYEINIHSRKLRLLTKRNENVVDFDFSPDEQQLALMVSETPKLDDVYRKSSLVIMNKKGSGRKQISENCRGRIKWSPNGRMIYFLKTLGKNIAPISAIYYVNSREVKIIFENYKASIGQVQWLKNSRKILARVQEGTKGYLVMLDISDQRVKKVRELKSPNYGGNVFCIDNSGGKVAYIDATYKSPPDIYFTNINGGNCKRLTYMNSQIDTITFGKVETIKWESDDGMEIEGVLIYPVNFEKGERYPLVVDIHGGPLWAWWEGWICSWHEWGQMLANNGYMVLMPNPRGSEGYGWEFAEANYMDWGFGDLNDIISGIKYLINIGLVDTQKVGIGGWSYGGFMTSWAVTQTDLFKAAVMGAGLSNLISMYGTTDIPTLLKIYFNGYPYGRENVYTKHSAIYYAKNVKTPILILHGQSDVRVPITQAYEFYQALRDFGVETKFVTYPREPHGIREPLHQIDLMYKVIDWFNKYLK